MCKYIAKQRHKGTWLIAMSLFDLFYWKTKSILQQTASMRIVFTGHWSSHYAEISCSGIRSRMCVYEHKRPSWVLIWDISVVSFRILCSRLIADVSIILCSKLIVYVFMTRYAFWNKNKIWCVYQCWNSVLCYENCLTAPSHNLNQCWVIVSEVLWHSPHGILAGNFRDIYPWYEF